MSDRGFFVVDRRVWEHSGFAREKFSEREAWIWLISSAAWEPTRVKVGRAEFDLERGQCVFSLRFLAVKWMWSEARVRRFLERRTTDAAVYVRATREATHITICKYNDYQLERRTDVASSDAPLFENRRKEEEINNIINNKHSSLRSETRAARATRLADDWMPSEVEIAFGEGRGLPRKQVEIEAQKFRNYWTAKGGKDATKTNWSRTWENWILNTGGKNGHGSFNGASRSSGADFFAGLASVAADIVGNDPAPRSADPAVPLGKFNIDV